MDADLTCPTCEDGTRRPGMVDGQGHCLTCGNYGRRLPTLAEWDALVAERDRLYDQNEVFESEVEDLHRQVSALRAVDRETP